MSNSLIFLIALFIVFIIYPPFMGLFAGFVIIAFIRFLISKILGGFS